LFNFDNGRKPISINSPCGFDMMSMMNLMREMNQGGVGPVAGGKKQKSGVNNQALRAMMKKQQLQKKLNN
jgi:hypothetical protein